MMKTIVVAFNLVFRNIDNISSTNDIRFHSYVDSMYPS